MKSSSRQLDASNTFFGCVCERECLIESERVFVSETESLCVLSRIGMGRVSPSRSQSDETELATGVVACCVGYWVFLAGRQQSLNLPSRLLCKSFVLF